MPATARRAINVSTTATIAPPPKTPESTGEKRPNAIELHELFRKREGRGHFDAGICG